MSVVARVRLLNTASSLVDIEVVGCMSGGSLLTLKEGRAAKAKDGDWIFGRLLYDILPTGCLPVYEETELKKIRR